MAHKKPSVSDTVYLDELTFSSVWRLLWLGEVTSVILLDAIKPAQRLWEWLIGLRGVNIVEASFFAGNLKTDNGETVRFASRRLAGEIALAVAKKTVQSEPHLRKLNEAYGRNTIRLFIAKQLHIYIEYWTNRALVSQAICVSGRAEVWLKQPDLFEVEFLYKAIPEISIYFYTSRRLGLLKLAISWIQDVARDFKLRYPTESNSRSGRVGTHKPSVLMMQENSIRTNRTLRGQPHWVDVSNPPDIFDTFIIELPAYKCSTVKNEKELTESGVRILSTSAFRHALQSARGNKVLQRIRRDRRRTIEAVFRAKEFANKYLLLRLAAQFRQSELMGALAIWMDARVFLTSETYYSFSDAMQLVAPDLGVTTIAYQYSNMGSVSPIMMSTVDKLMVFSDMYQALYRFDGISPQEFTSIGYQFDGIAGIVRDKAHRHRKILARAGANFVVCYFDESVQKDRWGFVSKREHLLELHALAEAVLADPAFGVVIKSQFIRNTPSQLYPDDKIIKAALMTGRYLELMEGDLRNDIYPSEAALAADICIGHKFGATAALEAAIAGVRTVLLDTHGIKTLWDDIYCTADIEYNSMDFLMTAIANYRHGCTHARNLGDWTPIIGNFDPFQDGNAEKRLRQEIHQVFVGQPGENAGLKRN